MKNSKRLFQLGVAFLLFVPLSGFSQAIKPDTIEITHTDITSIPEFKGNLGSAFGVKVGMKIPQAREAAKNFNGCPVIFEQDRYNNNRFYLYETGPRGKRRTLAYLLWNDHDSGLNELILFDDAKDCIPGGARLFSHEGLDSSSSLFSGFFGKPSKSMTELEIASLHLKNIRYYYPQLSLILVECMKEDKKTYQIVFYNPQKS